MIQEASDPKQKIMLISEANDSMLVSSHISDISNVSKDSRSRFYAAESANVTSRQLMSGEISPRKLYKTEKSHKSKSPSISMQKQQSIKLDDNIINSVSQISQIESVNSQIEENTPSAKEQMVAEIMLQQQSFNSNLKYEPETVFSVEKNSDGNIMPLPRKKAEDNQKLYLQKYATEFNLPSLYVLDSQIISKFPDYCIQLAKGVLPHREDYLVKTHNLDGTSSLNTFLEIEHKYSQGLILRLLLREKSQLIVVKDVIIDGVWNAKIRFSDCSNYFCMVIPQDGKTPEQIRLCRMYLDKGIEGIFEQMENHQYKLHVPEQKWEFPIQKVIFDQNSRFLVAVGNTKFMIYNLLKNESKVHEIETVMYQKIYDLNFCSTSQDEYKCYIACKRAVLFQIVVFDYFSESKEKHIKLNYKYQSTSKLIIKISRDFQTVIFTDVQEKLMVRKMEGYTLQRKLTQLEGKIVHLVYEAPQEPSMFYFIQAKEYDGSLKFSHSHRTKKVFKIARKIEKGRVNVFDLNMQIQKERSGKSTTKKFRLIGMQDDGFTFDEITVSEKVMSTNSSYQQEFEYSEIKMKSLKQSQMGAQSTSWPYFASSGFGNYMLLINAFHKKFIERIQLAPDEENITICYSYISDTYDLFVLILSKGVYKLFMVDLDKANPTEMVNESDNFRSQYSINEPIFEYTTDDVENRSFLAIHVRGSSRKEHLDRNENQFVYFLHQDHLYFWLMLNEESKNQKIKSIGQCSSTEFHVKQDGEFVFLQEDLVNGKLNQQRIIQIKTNFSEFQETVAMRKISSSRDKIIVIMIDQIAN